MLQTCPNKLGLFSSSLIIHILPLLIFISLKAQSRGQNIKKSKYKLSAELSVVLYPNRSGTSDSVLYKLEALWVKTCFSLAVICSSRPSVSLGWLDLVAIYLFKELLEKQVVTNIIKETDVLSTGFEFVINLFWVLMTHLQIHTCNEHLCMRPRTSALSGCIGVVWRLLVKLLVFFLDALHVKV